MIIIECCLSAAFCVLACQIGHQISGSEVALRFILSYPDFAGTDARILFVDLSSV